MQANIPVPFGKISILDRWTPPPPAVAGASPMSKLAARKGHQSGLLK